MERKLYQAISATLAAIENCEKSGNQEWLDKHESTIEKLICDYLPHGSGFDSGTILDREKSNPDKLVFHADFHHMDDNGYYCGWTEHEVIITPSLAYEFHIKVTGSNKREIKSYIADVFSGRMYQTINY